MKANPAANLHVEITLISNKKLKMNEITKFGMSIFYFIFALNLALPVPRYHGQLSSCTISEKTKDPILQKFSDGQMEGQTDRWTDRRESFHRKLSK